MLEACGLQCGNAGLGQTAVVTMRSMPVANVFLSIWSFLNGRWVRTEEQWRSEVNVGVYRIRDTTLTKKLTAAMLSRCDDHFSNSRRLF